MMTTLQGALLGLLLHLLRPFATLAVLVYAIRGRYPVWMITPDDLPRAGAKHFGEYEETVRNIYARFGRYVGDVYWLGFRNVLYGLAYMLKPKALYPHSVERWYTHLGAESTSYKLFNKEFLITYKVSGYGMIRLKIGPVVLLAGYKVDSIWNNPDEPRDPINMEGRPILSVRLTRNA